MNSPSKTVCMPTVLHLNSGKVDKQSELLGNLANLAEERPEEEIAAVLNSDAVEMAVEGGSAEQYVKEMDADLYVCSNSIENRGIREEELLDAFEVVPAAVAKLSELQDQGYSYIKI